MAKVVCCSAMIADDVDEKGEEKVTWDGLYLYMLDLCWNGSDVTL